MSDNLRHWSALSKTDPKHTKPFTRAGGFKGTATKPIWTEYRLTEHFGPCGEGWGTEQPIFTIVPANDEILVFCSLQCWYSENGAPKFVWGIGGDKVLVKQQSGLRTDDEAYKKAFTDALGNAFKHVGAGADVHMGLFEDSKYIAEMRREFADEASPAAQQPERSATNGSGGPAVAGGANGADDGKNLARCREARDRIKAAIEKAEEPVIVDEILRVNRVDLEFILGFHEKTYSFLMGMATARTNELLASA